MSRDTVIRVEKISKRYLLGQGAPVDNGLRHRIEKIASAPFRWLRAGRPEKNRNPEFWALRDVSFEVRQGEVVGILGRNGAGKSTLLKILSRITEPTEGAIGLKGRVSSLLEVGTGFHAELTGRENIFLNGAILGMTQAEVRRKLDEIIAFAGVEKFLDTPIKRYSSGMYVRLAFAVAAHLEPEILIVDEVLAVGDSEFQKKCLGKMQEVTQGGRTVLFVSHNLAALSSLCHRGVYLREGQVARTGPIDSTLELYKQDIAHAAAERIPPRQRAGSGTHRIREVIPRAEEFPAREPISLRVEIEQHRDDGPFHLALHFRNELGVEILLVSTEQRASGLIEPGHSQWEIAVRSPWLPPGDYYVDTYLYSGGILDMWPNACGFRIDNDVAKDGFSPVIGLGSTSYLADFAIAPRRS